MSISFLLQIYRTIDVVAFVISSIVNGVLLNLINNHSPPSFGNYTYLMSAFVCNCLFFSSIHAFIQPMIAIEKYVVFVFSYTNYLDIPNIAMRTFLALYGVGYSQTLILIAVQFVYRCISIRCRKYLFIFQGKYMIVWFISVATFGINWGLCIFILAQETDQVGNMIRPVLKQNFNLTMSQINYVAANYISTNDNGERVINYSVVYMVANFGIIMVNYFGGLGSSLFVIIVSVLTIRAEFRQYNYSSYQDNHQKQLFRSLLVQMMIPVLLIYIPIIASLTMPLLGISINNSIFIPITSIFISIYPVLDSISVIAIISVYRQKFLDMFKNEMKSPAIIFTTQ